MIYPIRLFGDPVLRKVAKDIDLDKDKINEILENMFETMYQADGVGLAAPQVGLSTRIFIVDASGMDEEDEDLVDFKRVFINAEILKREGDVELFTEGCLSIPGIREDVKRETIVMMKYLDENLKEHEEIFEGIPARIVQHEYDHLDGVMFVDKLMPLKRRLLKAKLNSITKGDVSISYRIKIPKR